MPPDHLRRDEKRNNSKQMAMGARGTHRNGGGLEDGSDLGEDLKVRSNEHLAGADCGP
jgi:hypothetical protein